jgi:hypothetical protein
MTEPQEDLSQRLQTYLGAYDRQAQKIRARQSHRWGTDQLHQRPKRRSIRLLQASAVVASTTIIFLVFAVGFAAGRSAATSQSIIGIGTKSTAAATTPSATAPVTPIETLCARLPRPANFNLYSVAPIAPDPSSAAVSCKAAIVTAGSACPSTRPVCAGVPPKNADLSLLSGFGTVPYPAQFGGYHKEPVWMMSWPLSCSLVGPSMPGPKLGLVEQLPPTTSNSCSYVEFVSARSGAFLFSTATKSCYPWIGPADGPSCQSPKQ